MRHFCSVSEFMMYKRAAKLCYADYLLSVLTKHSTYAGDEISSYRIVILLLQTVKTVWD